MSKFHALQVLWIASYKETFIQTLWKALEIASLCIPNFDKPAYHESDSAGTNTVFGLMEYNGRERI